MVSNDSRTRSTRAARRQQLGEGWFPTLDDVPRYAVTLTVPAIMRCHTISRVAGAVPDRSSVRDSEIRQNFSEMFRRLDVWLPRRCVVPDSRKAEAVKNALKGPVTTACPASILQTHRDCVLWLDDNSAAGLDV